MTKVPTIVLVLLLCLVSAQIYFPESEHADSLFFEPKPYHKFDRKKDIRERTQKTVQKIQLKLLPIMGKAHIDNAKKYAKIKGAKYSKKALDSISKGKFSKFLAKRAAEKAAKKAAKKAAAGAAKKMARSITKTGGKVVKAASTSSKSVRAASKAASAAAKASKGLKAGVKAIGKAQPGIGLALAAISTAIDTDQVW
jgi:hypothetical protein